MSEHAEWRGKRFADVTVNDYISAQLLSQHWGRERVFIEAFMSGTAHIVLDENANAYEHNLLQFSQSDFFGKEMEFQKLSEGMADREGAAAVYEMIEVSHEKFIRGYATAAVGYRTGKGEKILLIVERRDAQNVQYRLYVPPEYGDLYQKWGEASRRVNFYRGQKLTAACRFLDLRTSCWEEVILPVGTKNLLRNMLNRSARKRELAVRNNLSLKRGVLLKGKPGNGKTSAIRVIASEFDGTVIYAQPAHLTDAREVRNVCVMARDLAPTLLILEDIDWIAEDRNTGDAGRVIELMNQLDGLEGFDDVVTVGTTNDVEKIEGAIKNRPGRFDRVIDIPDPDEACRRQMLSLFTRHWVLGEDVKEAAVVSLTAGLSGAHMADLCNTAADYALDEDSVNKEQVLVLRGRHFRSAVEEVKNKDYSHWMMLKGKGSRIGFREDEDDDD